MFISKNQACLGLVLCHLGLVALGASNVNLSGLGSLGRVLEDYGELSGAGSSYGFFAPGISSQLRVRFDLLDSEDGRRNFIWGASSEPNLQSSETRLRLGNIVDQFPLGMSQGNSDGESDEEVEVKRSLSASLAVNMFKRYPEVHVLTVFLEEYVPVSMADFRAGLSSNWRTLYLAKFRRPG